MDEVPSTPDYPELRNFLGNSSGAMFTDREKQSVWGSSHEAGWVPLTARRPSNLQASMNDMAFAGRKKLDAGTHENASLFDARSLTSAFENMNFRCADGAAGSAANSCSVTFRDGHYPAGGLAISSGDSARNGPIQQAFTQTDDFVHSPLMINSAEHMKRMFGARSPPACTGMDDSDIAYVTSINRPLASPFQEQLVSSEWSQNYKPYQQVDSKFRRHDVAVERHSHMQTYSCQQMPHVATSDLHWIDSSQCGAINYSAKSFASPNLSMPIVHHLGHGNADTYWNGAMGLNGHNQMDSTQVNKNPSVIYHDCSCEICEYCQVRLSERLKHPYGLRRPPQGSIQNHIFGEVKLKYTPEQILRNSEVLDSILNTDPGFALNRCADTNQRTNCNELNHHLNIKSNRSLHFGLQSSQILSSLESDLALKSAQFKHNFVNKVVGELYLLTKDQNGCCFLQRIFTEGSQDNAQKVFDCVIEHIDELMVDQFGNYLVQRLFEECNEDQKMHIVYEITKRPGQLIKVSCNMHGTRVVQKVIDTMKNSDEISMVVSALSPGAITLMMDANGSHVVHRCLQKLSPEYKAFLLNAAVKYFLELAKDRHGCCIIQKCILYANKEQKNKLLYNMTSRALDLAEHHYGNYVIQYILELNVRWATDEILDKLDGHYGYLSMQKFSSNVVEKCIKEAREPKRVKIIHELISDPKLRHILLDQFGNYVIQTALRECQDAAVQDALIDAIRPHTSALRNNMFGKRVLSKTCLKNRKN